MANTNENTDAPKVPDTETTVYVTESILASGAKQGLETRSGEAPTQDK